MTVRRALATLAIPGALLLTGCGGGGTEQGAGTATPARPPVPELAPVVATEQARLEAELAADAEAPPEEADPEQIQGLATLLASSSGASMRGVALEEAKGLGDAALPELLRLLEGDDDALAAAALELLGALDTPAAAEVLVERVEQGDPAWVRAHAAWRLVGTSQDQVLPRLALRLKYETDFDTVIWIGNVLGGLGNYAGLEGTYVVATNSGDERLSQSAWASLRTLTEEAGYGDYAELWAAWDEGQVEEPERSPRYDAEIWSWIARFPEFQLRGVDDGRFVLSGQGARTAEICGQALFDESLYIRVHAAQCLERMGRRAHPAAAELIRALGEPSSGPDAAAALGATSGPGAEEALLPLVDEGPRFALRLAATRALGSLGDDAGEATRGKLLDMLAGDSPELVQAAAESLAALDAGTECIGVLAEFLIDPRVTKGSTQRALRAWLGRRDEAGDAAATAAIEAWDALEPQGGDIPAAEEYGRIREERRRQILGYLDAPDGAATPEPAADSGT